MPLILPIRYFINIPLYKVQSNPSGLSWIRCCCRRLFLCRLLLLLSLLLVLMWSWRTRLLDSFIKFGIVSTTWSYYSIKCSQAAGRLAQFCLDDFPWHSNVAMHMALRATCSFKHLLTSSIARFARYTLCVEDHFGDVFRERLFLVGNDQYNFQV